MSKRIFFIMVIVAALPAYAQDGDQSERTGFRPDAPPYGVRGPYPVGTMEMVIEDSGTSFGGDDMVSGRR